MNWDMASKWTKEEKMRTWVIGITVPVVIGLLAFFQQDLRKIIGLDKPAKTIVQAPALPKPQAQTEPASSASLQVKQQSNNNVKGQTNVVGNNISGKGNVVGNSNQVSQGNSPITNALGGIANNGGIVTNPTVNNFPTPHPFDPYDGVPDSKVAEDATGMANRFFNSVKACDDGSKEAAQQDIDSKDPNHPMYKFYVFRTRDNIQKYSKDLRDLQTSLIYRLGPAERDADAEEILNKLLEKHNPSDGWPHYFDFNCWQFQQMGEYFYRLGNRLKVRARVQP